MIDAERLLPELGPSLAGWVGLLFALIVVAAITSFALFGWLLFKSGQLNHPAPLVVSLALLTAVALVGGIATGSSDVLNLAAVGFGALAGSLAVVYRAVDRKEDDEKPLPPNDIPDDEGAD